MKVTEKDLWGRTTGVIPNEGPGVTYGYDEQDRLTLAQHGAAQTEIGYNAAGWKTWMQDADMGEWQYTYDALGNLTAQTDARGCATGLSYDELNRLTGKSYSSCPATGAVSYRYDGGTGQKGYRTGMADGSGTTAWSYDSRGRKVAEMKSMDGHAFTTQWAYNSASLITGITYPMDDSGAAGEVVTTGYAAHMAVQSVVGASPYVTSSEYDDYARLSARYLGMGSGAGQLRTRQAYYPWQASPGNSLGRLSSIQTGTETQPGLRQALSYAYFWSGNIQSIQDGLAGPQTQSFTYDTLDRVLSAQASGGSDGLYAEGYAYDPTSGNLAAKGGVSYAYNDPAHAHAVTGLSNGQTYSYDANGNQTGRVMGADSYTLSYDAENRLVGVSKNGAQIASYGYDGDGQRVSATAGGTTTLYVSDLFEWQVETGSATRYYYAGGQRVAMRVGSALSFLLADHLGSTTFTLDANGSQVAELRYKAFGETRYSQGSTPTARRYTGQHEAEEVGLYYYGARWYDSDLNRFLSPDTIVPEKMQGVQAWDRYAYSSNNPINYNDPSGHFATLATAFAGAAIGFAIDAGFQLVPQLLEGKAITECEYSIAQGAGAAAGGFVGGLTLGIGSGIIALAATGSTSVTGAAAIASGAMAGALANPIGNQTGALVQGAIETDSPLFSTTAINQAATYGYGDMNQMLTDSVVGAFTGGLTSIKFPAGNKISIIDRSYPLDSGGSRWVSQPLTSKLGNEVRTFGSAAKTGAFYQAITDFGSWLAEGINQAVN